MHEVANTSRGECVENEKRDPADDKQELPAIDTPKWSSFISGVLDATAATAYRPLSGPGSGSRA
eukprot:3227785-Rhodomonas_salina.3